MKIHQKIKYLIEHDNMPIGVFLASLLESTIIPIPLEAILIPVFQQQRKSIWLTASMATLGCICGAAIGYGIGYTLFDAVIPWLMNVELVSQTQLDKVIENINRNGFSYVLTLGVTPIPFQVAMLGAGAAHYSLSMFLLATFIARSIRYFGLALIVYYFGNKAEKLIKKYKFAVVFFGLCYGDSVLAIKIDQ